METYQEKQKVGMFKPALNHALIISAALIILTLTYYLTNQLQNKYVGWISGAVSLAGIIYAIFSYRNQYLGGYISYGRAVGYAVIVGLIVGVITGLFTFILYGYISPELVDQAREAVRDQMLTANPDLQPEQEEMAMGIQAKLISPIGMLISGIFGGALQGLIFGLIGGIFAQKKERDSF